MKITEETQSLMVLKDNNILVTFPFGILFTVAGLLFVFPTHLFVENPPLWAALIFIMLGIITIFASRITTITLDKTTNRFSFVVWRLFGKKTQQNSLDQIGKVQFRQIYQETFSKGQPRARISNQLVFILKNGDEILVNQSYGTTIQIPFFWPIVISGIRKNGVRIANFLGVPFEELKPPSIGEVLREIPEIVQKEIKNQETQDTSSA